MMLHNMEHGAYYACYTNCRMSAAHALREPYKKDFDNLLKRHYFCWKIEVFLDSKIRQHPEQFVQVVVHIYCITCVRK